MCYRGWVRVHLICVRAHMERRGEQRGSFSVKDEGCERLSREAINLKKEMTRPPNIPNIVIINIKSSTFQDLWKKQ